MRFLGGFVRVRMRWSWPSREPDGRQRWQGKGPEPSMDKGKRSVSQSPEERRALWRDQQTVSVNLGPL
jgi:hypothetical protein